MAKASKEFLYGLNPAFEAIRAGRRTIYQAFLNEAIGNNPRIAKLAELLQQRDVPVEWTDKGHLHQLSGSKEHQGAVLRTSLYPYVDSDDLFNAPRLLMLDNVEDPHNVGALLRSAEVFGFNHVLLPHKGVPEVYPSVVKVSTGACEFMQIARDRSANQYARAAQEAGYHVASLDAKGKVDLEQLAVQPPEKLLLVIGGEDKCVGQFILNLSDSIVSIRQHGKVNSLNASVAGSLAMFMLAIR
jgi:23S rRNA (guanosine2251-2'-O)-methyltransferase